MSPRKLSSPVLIFLVTSVCAVFQPDVSELKEETEKYVFAYSISLSLKPEGYVEFGRFSDSRVLSQIQLIIKSNENVVGEINAEAMIDKGCVSCPALPGSIEGSLAFIQARMGGTIGNPLVFEIAKFPLLLPDYIFLYLISRLSSVKTVYSLYLSFHLPFIKTFRSLS
nr:hypothetical protein [Tanacetum cinerariifolium]